MKFFILTSFLILSVGCGQPDAEFQDPSVETEVEDQAVVPNSFVNSSTNPEFYPETGQVAGMMGPFKDINAETYTIELNDVAIYSYAYHGEGRVMTQLRFFKPIHKYLDEDTHSFKLDENTLEFYALGCQADNLDYWNYDSQAESGTINIVPVGDDTWVVQYSLAWSGDFLNGSVTIIGR